MGGFATIDSLKTNSINGIPVNELMTVSTDQTITANTMISRIITQRNVQASLLNNMKRFADNVVLLGQDNVIECMLLFHYFSLSKNCLIQPLIFIQRHDPYSSTFH